jgi:hypothetical protein
MGEGRKKKKEKNLALGKTKRERLGGSRKG